MIYHWIRQSEQQSICTGDGCTRRIWRVGRSWFWHVFVMGIGIAAEGCEPEQWLAMKKAEGFQELSRGREL